MQFVIHKLERDGNINYQLTYGDGDKLQFYDFHRTGLMSTLSNNPNVTRLFGEESEDTRSSKWMNYEGDTKDGIYTIIDKGEVKIKERSNKHVVLGLRGKLLTDDWILRKIPDVFDKSLFAEGRGCLLWKPPVRGEGCPTCRISKFSNLDLDQSDVQDGRFNLDISFNEEEQTFEGVAAAEGTWVDLFGVPYIYTAEFIQKIAQEQQMKLSEGASIPLNTEHPSDELAIDGFVTEVLLVREPINHIRVKGKYHGATTLTEGEVGLSYEFRFRSVWNEDFQAWIPFDNITDKLSVVKRPACKICWITKVK